jgi:hypothetical protein
LAQAEELPEEWPYEAYTVPAAHKELEHFYRISLEPEQFALEMQRLGGLWPEFDLHFARSGRQPRQPARALSPWHLALSLAAGAISGVVTSPSGKTLIVKGNTYKAKTSKVEFTEDENGNITEIRTMVDKFVPVIKAWDMTPQSETYGCVLTISSGVDTAPQPSKEVGQGAIDEDASEELTPCPLVIELPRQEVFPAGCIVATRAVSDYAKHGELNISPYLTRHLAGDWGDLSDSDRRQNDQALKSENDRLFSSYNLGRKFERDDKLWIITECDRSVTTVLFPSDY